VLTSHFGLQVAQKRHEERKWEKAVKESSKRKQKDLPVRKQVSALEQEVAAAKQDSTTGNASLNLKASFFC
jgi:hypothetical protein